jgi:hypothetical protein
MTLEVGARVRDKPGFGTYGDEGSVEADGRVPAEVVWFARTRVRIRVKTDRGIEVRGVDAASLKKADPA